VELYQVKYFLTLCETLNFARAAERCNVSQPSLTRAVQKLEQELGGLLVVRGGHHTHLTELGALVRPMLNEVLSHSQLVKSVAEKHLDSKRKVLRVGYMPSIGPTRLAPLLTRFGVEQPEVELALVEASHLSLSDLLLNSRLDAMVAAHVSRPDRRLRYCRLYREQIVVVVPKGHRFQELKTVRLRELEGERFLFRTNCDLGEFLLQCCRKQGFEPCIVYRGARESWVQAMVAAGFGITVMPEFSHTNVASVTRPLVDPDLARELSLVTVAGRRHEAALSCLLRAAREEVVQAKGPYPARSLITFPGTLWSRIEPGA
jgi:LysR family transcriptional regulator, hydrogen peroxide-inducible genes activator